MIEVSLDGPTVVIKLIDATAGERDVYTDPWAAPGPPSRPFQLQVKLLEGIGLSVINQVPEEVMYLKMKGLSLEVEMAEEKLTVVFDLEGFQVCGQLGHGG